MCAFSTAHSATFGTTCAATPGHTSTKLRWFSRFCHFTRTGHIPGGGGRPLLREGGPFSYEARPSRCFSPILERNVSLKSGFAVQIPRCCVARDSLSARLSPQSPHILWLTNFRLVAWRGCRTGLGVRSVSFRGDER